jgi:hypothetical protein
MTVETLPWSIQGQSHPATVARNAVAGMLGAPAVALTPAASVTTAGGSHGVVGGADLAVAQNGTPNMSVNVAGGRAFIRSTFTGSLGQGTYSFFNDVTVNLAVAASDPTNPRRDLVIAQVRDTNHGGAANDARLTVVTGTPAAVPADPTVPASCVVLARIAVAAGSTTVLNAAITDLRTFATAIGGVQRCTSTARPTGVSLFEGLYIDELDTDRTWRYDGTGWTFVGGKHPRCTVTRSAAQVIANATNTAITWDTESADTDAIHSTVTNTSRLTVPAGMGGLWGIGYTLEWAIAPGAGQRAAWLSINGNTTGRLAYNLPASMPGTDTPAYAGFTTVALNAGDFVELYVYQATGGNVSAATSSNSTLNAYYVGPT